MAAPTFVSALSSQDGLTVEVLLSETILPANGDITGFSIGQSTAPTTIVVSAASRKGTSGDDNRTIVLTLATKLTALSTITVSYTYVSGAHVTDSGGLNNMGNFSGQAVTNFTSRPKFYSATTTPNGEAIDVLLSDVDSTAVLPTSSEIPGWCYRINGGGDLTPTSAKRKGSSGVNKKTIRLVPTSTLVAGQTIEVKYTPGSPAITDNTSPTVVPLLAFGYTAVTNATIELVAPTISGTPAAGASGLTIEVVFSEDVKPEEGDLSGWSVTENASPVTISQVQRKGDGADADTIVITLESALTKDSTTTIDYTQPTDGSALTDLVGNKLANVVAQSVTTSGISERVAPTLSSATTNASGTYIDATFTENMLPASGILGFTATVNGVSRTLASVAQQSSTVYRLTLASAVTCEDAVKISYDAVTGNVTDTATIPNDLASFTNASVTNAMSDTSAPVFVDAVTTTDGTRVKVRFRENKNPPLTPSTGITGFSVKVNGRPRTFRDSADNIHMGYVGSNDTTVETLRVVYLDLHAPIRPGDSVVVSYLPTGSLTTDLEDSDNHAIAAFSAIVTNLSVAPPQFFDPLAWVLSGGDAPTCELFERRIGYPMAAVILDREPPVGEAIINENSSSGGALVHYFAAFATNDSEDPATVGDDTLNHKYKAIQFEAPGDQDITHVEIKLKRTGTITNGSERLTIGLYADSGEDAPGTLIQQVLRDDSPRYDSLTTSYVAYKMPLSTRILDNTKYWIVVSYRSEPMGGTIAQPLVDDGLIAFRDSAEDAWDTISGDGLYYKLYGADVNATPLPGRDEVVDPLGNVIKEADSFGGSDNEASYEVIGLGHNRSIVKRLDKQSGAYPKVSSIQVGLTASKSKSYLVEAMVPDGEWQPLFTMIANTTTRDYIRYTFDSAVQLAGIRLRYRGDFYAASNDGQITLSAYDPHTDVTHVQASRFEDFRDRTDFADSLPGSGADSEGWVPFKEGTTTYDWTLVDLATTWVEQDGQANGGLNKAVVLGNGLVTYGDHRLYSFTSDPGLEAQDYTVPFPDFINASTVHRNKLYVGLSTGALLESTGDTYSIVLSSVASPVVEITALLSYRGKLWIGTSEDSNGRASLYTWDGTGTLAFVRTFDQSTVRSMAQKNGTLFLAAGGATTSAQGRVYMFDGTSWSLTLSTDEDAVECLAPSTADGKLWAGLSGGAIWALTFDSNGKPQAWAKVYDSDATTYYSLVDDPSGNFMWATSDAGLVVYAKSRNAFQVVDKPTPKQGLRAIWTNSDADNYTTVGEGDSQVVEMGVQVNRSDITSSRPAAVNGTYINLRYEGYIKAEYSEEYTFTVQANDGCRLYLNGNLIIDEWTTQTTLNSSVSDPVPMEQDKFLPIVVEYFNGDNTGDSQPPGVVLKWQSSSTALAVVPLAKLGMPNLIRDLAYLGDAAYAVAEDGEVYAFETSSLETKKRAIYVRFRDAAGNETPLPGFSDTVIQDAATVGGVRVSDGRIYQVHVDKSVIATFASKEAKALLAPDRQIRESGFYESEPFFAATLTRWDKVSFLASLDAGVSQGAGLQYGMDVQIFVRTADTYEGVLAADWGTAFDRTTIDAPANAGIATSEFNIASFTGKWLQFKLVLETASRGLSPEVRAVTVSYKAANASYFFTRLFDTSAEVSTPFPLYRRGLLTANTLPNGGSVQFGYTTDDTEGNRFDFARYTVFQPNTVFELADPAQQIRFGVLLVSENTTNPATMHEFGVMLDSGDIDMRLMDPFQPDHLDNLQLWLDASQIFNLNDGDPVSTWADRSSNARNGTSSGGARPLYRASAVGGQPALEFNPGGTPDQISVPTTVLESLSSATVYVVFNSSNFASSRTLFDATNGQWSMALGSAYKIKVGSNTATVFTPAGAFSTSTDYIVSMVFDKDTDVATIYQNGTLSDTVGSLADIVSSQNWILGNNISSVGTAAWQGYIAEVVLYSDAHSDADRAKVEAYLADKYGI